MDTSKFWTELIIAGSFYLLALVFLIFKVLHVDDLSFLVGFTEYLVPLSAVVLVTSYLLGVLFHRILPILLKIPSQLFEKVVGKKGLLASDIAGTSSQEPTRIKILQLGSERLNSELDYQFRHMVLFRLLAVGIPLAGVSCAAWLLEVKENTLALLITLISFTFGIGFLYAHIRQRRIYQRFRDVAFKEFENLIKQSKIGKG